MVHRAVPAVALATPLAVSRYGSPVRRFVAALIDLALASVMAIFVLLVVPHPAFNPSDWGSWHTALLVDGALDVACWYAYLVASEAIWSTTLGKRVLRLRVAMMGGSRCTPLAAVLRNVTKIAFSPYVVPFVGVVFARQGFELFSVGSEQVVTLAVLAGLVLTFIVMSQSSTTQRLGDRMAGTVVVRTAQARDAAPAPRARRPQYVGRRDAEDAELARRARSQMMDDLDDTDETAV